MRDVAIVQRFLPGRSRGGVGVFTHGLASTLVARGNAVTVFSQDPAPAGSTYRVVNVPVRVDRLAPLAFPFAVRRVDFRGHDVIHAQGDEQFVAHRHQPPIVRTLHGTALAEAWFNGVRSGSPKRAALHMYFYASEWLAAARADAVVAVSHHTTKFYPHVTAVIPNGIDLGAWAPDGSGKSAEPTILFVGEVDSRKRGRLLIDTFVREVRAVVPTSRLWVVSPDRVDAPGVEWRGPVPDAELHDLMRRAWILCLPSAYEGFGRPYIEAMAAGTAVVASRNPGAREVLDGGRYGVMASDAELGAAIVRLLTDAGARRAFEERGLARAQAFAWPTVAAAYERVYDDVIASRRARTV